MKDILIMRDVKTNDGVGVVPHVVFCWCLPQGYGFNNYGLCARWEAQQTGRCPVARTALASQTQNLVWQN